MHPCDAFRHGVQARQIAFQVGVVGAHDVIHEFHRRKQGGVFGGFAFFLHAGFQLVHHRFRSDAFQVTCLAERAAALAAEVDAEGLENPGEPRCFGDDFTDGAVKQRRSGGREDGWGMAHDECNIHPRGCLLKNKRIFIRELRIDARGVISMHQFMNTYSKLAQAGISAVSYLASIAGEARLAGSAEIATSREMSRQLIAKVLTLLSRARLVEGTPGPSGGYRLARPAAEITLLDVVKVFENLETRVMCPFGPNWCGHGPNCPLHDTFFEMHQNAIDRLAGETFGQFEKPG